MTTEEPDQRDQPDQLAADYRTSVDAAVQRLVDRGLVHVDDDKATLTGAGLQLLQDLVIAWSVQTIGIPQRAMRLAHHAGVAFGSTLVAAMASIGPDPIRAQQAYQQALTTVRHLKRTIDA